MVSRKRTKMKRNQISAVANFRKNVEMANREDLNELINDWLKPHDFNCKIEEVVDNRRVKFKVMVFHHCDYYTTLYVDKVVCSDDFKFSDIDAANPFFPNYRHGQRNRKNQLGSKSAWAVDIDYNGKRGKMLVSYNAIIAFKPCGEDTVFLTREARAYSNTTNRHISAFCGGCLQVYAD